MNKQELLYLIEAKIEGQGNQVDTGSILPTILKGLVNGVADTLLEVDDFEEFDATTPYSQGDVVRYDGKLYEFTTDHTGEWNEDDVEQTNVFTLLTNYVDGNVDTINEKIAQILLDILGLKNATTLLGDLRVRNLTTDNIPMVCGFPKELTANGAPSADNVPTNWNTETMGQWTGVPCFVGQEYIDQANHKFYKADNDTAVSGFRALN